MPGTLCINTAEGPGFLCQCPPGFTGDGRHSGSGCQGKQCNTMYCILLVLTYCRGDNDSYNFTGLSYIIDCVVIIFLDVDECSTEPDVCVSAANCSNTEGGYSCQCPFGYVGDGRSDGNGCTGQHI